MLIPVFRPAAAASVYLDATSTSSRVAVGIQADALYIANNGPNAAFLEFGNSSVTAVKNTAMCLPAYQPVIVTGLAGTHVAAICSTGETARVQITPERTI